MARAPQQALVNQAPTGLDPSGFDPSRKKQPKMRAWAVTEEDEGTGGIVFAKHGIVALKWGACQFGGGEWEYYKARRAAWADEFAESGVMPASVMVEHGWHFECTGCGILIDEYLWDRHRRFRNWKPEHVVGTQHQVWCTPRCHDQDLAERARRKRHEELIVEMMARLVKRRFPSVEIIRDQKNLTPHVYVTKDKHGFWRLGQAVVSFNFPGMKIAPANYSWDRNATYGDKKAHFTCCAGDKEAFEAWVRDSDASSSEDPKGLSGEAVAARAEGIAQGDPS